jgi:hypothetical protein
MAANIRGALDMAIFLLANMDLQSRASSGDDTGGAMRKTYLRKIPFAAEAVLFRR